MKYLFLLSSLLITSLGLAQDDSYNYDNAEKPRTLEISEKQGYSAVIPFDLKLYYSHFDREMCKANNMDPVALRESIRLAFMQSFESAIDTSKSTISLIQEGKFDADELNMIHGGIGYNSQVIPEKVDSNETEIKKLSKKLKKKFKKKEKPKKTGTYIENGQIVTVKDTRKKYTASHIKNEALLVVLNQKYTNEVFVFINKFELTFPTNSSQSDIQHGRYQKEVKVHYSILSKEGKELTGGIASTLFPYEYKTIESLQEQVFPELVNMIMQDVPAKNK